jgi:hypothetical protein
VLAVAARTWPSLAAGGLGVALVLQQAWHSGGYFPSGHLWAGAASFAGLGVLLAVRPPHYRLGTPALVALAALAALAAWTGISARWSLAPDRAIEAMQLTLGYVGLLGLGLLAAGSGRLSRALAGAVLAAAMAIVVAGLLSRLYPGLVPSPPPSPAVPTYRLAYPLGYWNTFGALAAMAGVLALGIAADARAALALRAAGAGATVLAASALYLSLSRGSWLAMMAGLVVLVLLGPRPASMLSSLAIAGGAAALAIARLASAPALVDDPAAGAGQAAAGRAAGPVLLALALGAAALQVLIAAGGASVALAPIRRFGRRAVLAVVAVAAVAALGVYAVVPGKVDGRAARELGSARGFVDRQWSDFMRPAEAGGNEPGEGRQRLTTSSGTRSDHYRVALDGFSAHPLVGDGAGSYGTRWMRERPVDAKVENAHSLYLETLSELGIVGGGLLGLFLGAIVCAALAARRHPRALGRARVAAVSAACVVWIVHAGVDWDWQMPALTGVFILLAAALLPVGRTTPGAGRERRPRGLAAARLRR